VNISFRIRRKRVIAAAVLALALGGFAVAAPAYADTSTNTSTDVIGNAVITDSVTSGDVTAPDSIVDCATKQMAILSVEAVVMPVGCLTEYNGQWYKVSWTGTGYSTELTEQDDGNFVLYAGNGKIWAANTRHATNANGPGCLAQFQGDANFVVRNCDLAAIWASNTHTYPDAILAFQSDGNLVIYNSASTLKAIWAAGTDS
jgi:hypothetical protein